MLYGRRCRVLISKNGTTALDISGLDVHFKITKSMGDNGNNGEITIYNLSPQSMKKQISKGSRIMIEAGYEDGPYGMIFDGDIWDYQSYKEDGITRVLQILAKDGDVFLNGSFIKQSFSAGMTTKDLLGAFVGKGDITLGEISPSLLGTKLPRGTALYGQPQKLLSNISKSENARAFINDRKLHLVKADDPPKGQIVSLTPKSGLIGSPKQTKEGISAVCLLNPTLNLNKFVHVESAYIERDMVKIGEKKLQADLPGSGIYKILKLSHYGGVRENDWYTEIEGIPQPGLKPVTLQNFAK